MTKREIINKIDEKVVLMGNITPDHKLDTPRRVPSSIELHEQDVPLDWQYDLLKCQKIGGVFLVFMSGKTQKELKDKSKALKDFCKNLKKGQK